MRLKWKQIKTMAPHCGDCSEQLRGNNSLMNPYECSCGKWEAKRGDDYKLVISEFVKIYEI